MAIPRFGLPVTTGGKVGFSNPEPGFRHQRGFRIQANQLLKPVDGLLVLAGQRVGFRHLVQEFIQPAGESPPGQDVFIALQHVLVDTRLLFGGKTHLLAGAVTDVVQAVEGIDAHFRFVRTLEQLLVAASNFGRRNGR